MARASPLELYKSVKNLLASSGDNLANFCNTLSGLSKHKSKRLILNSMDSVFEGVNLPQDSRSKLQAKGTLVASSLVKVPMAVFVSKNQQEDSKSQLLSSFLENSLKSINEQERNLRDFDSVFRELRATSQFISENGLYDKFGGLRSFVLDYLDKYQQALLSDDSLPTVEKLTLLLNLYDVMRTHSLNTTRIYHKVMSLIDMSPEFLRTLPFETLSKISKLSLPQNSDEGYSEYLKSLVFANLKKIVSTLSLVFTHFDDRPVLETFLFAVTNKLKTELLEKEDLMELLRSLRILNGRHKHPDLTNITNNILELVYPKVAQIFLIEDEDLMTEGVIEENKDTTKEEFKDNEDLIMIFETYMTMFKKNSLKKNCLQGLVNHVLENKEQFTPTQLIRIIDSINNGGTESNEKVLFKNTYLGMKDVNNELTKHLLSELNTLEFNELCQLLYSLPLINHFQLYQIFRNYPENTSRVEVTKEEEELRLKVLEIVKRRIIHNVGNTDDKNNTMYSKYLTNIMLHNDYDLNSYFEGSIGNIIQNLSMGQLINIVTTINNENNLNQEVLNQVLERINEKLDSVHQMEPLNQLLEKNRYLKNTKLNNKLFSIMTHKLIDTKNGYLKLLQSIPYLSNDIDQTLVNIIMQHLNRYKTHLSLYDADLLLQFMHKFKPNDKNLLVLLNQLYEHNLFNTSNEVLINILVHLKNLKFRHEPLIKKFTDRLLTSFKSSNAYHIPELIKLVDSLSAMSIPYNDLYVYLLNYMSVNAAGEERERRDYGYNRDQTNSFGSLNIRDKINLLHSIANFGIVDDNLKKLYLSVIDQIYPEQEGENRLNKEGGLKETEGLREESKAAKEGGVREHFRGEKVEENEMLLKLYEIHIDLILNNIYNDEGDRISNRLEKPSKVWFTRQELKSHNFKKSNAYITIKDSLDTLKVKYESGVTEIYFCNFIMREREKPTVLYLVPEEDYLRFWTTSLEPKNMVSSCDISVGNSQKIIKNLKLSGYKVLELSQSKWEGLQSDRTSYLEKILGLK